MSKTSPSPLSASDTEALFCVALLNTLDPRQTADVLAKFLELRENPRPALVALGRRIPPPDWMTIYPQPTPAQPVPPTTQPTDTIRTADNPNFRP